MSWCIDTNYNNFESLSAISQELQRIGSQKGSYVRPSIKAVYSRRLVVWCCSRWTQELLELLLSPHMTGPAEGALEAFAVASLPRHNGFIDARNFTSLNGPGQTLIESIEKLSRASTYAPTKTLSNEHGKSVPSLKVRRAKSWLQAACSGGITRR